MKFSLTWLKDHLDTEHYDFILDTSSLTPQEVLEKVLTAVKDR